MADPLVPQLESSHGTRLTVIFLKLKTINKGSLVVEQGNVTKTMIKINQNAERLKGGCLLQYNSHLSSIRKQNGYLFV